MPHDRLEEDDARWSATIETSLPAGDSWPHLVYSLPDLQYPDRLNLAGVLLDGRTNAARVALACEEATMSYGQLRRRVAGVARELIALGVKPADRVAFRLHNGPTFVAVWLAVQWIGAIAVPIPPAYRRREIAYIINHADSRLVLCGADSMPAVSAAREAFQADVRVVSLEQHGWSSERDRDTTFGGSFKTDSDEPPLHPTRREYPTLITYISSAEGPLKGVVHTPAELLASADTYARRVLALASDDICIGTVTMAWCFGLGALLLFPLRLGARAVLLNTGTVSLLGGIAASRATVLFGVPTMYRMLLRLAALERFELGSLRLCVSAAEPLPPDVAREWYARTGLEILDGLGTTEMAHIFISAPSGAARPGLLGRPVDGFDARVIGEDCRELPRGTPGRLAVRGPVGALYWRNSDAQQRAVIDGWTLSGDRCIEHADGWFEHLGRTDELIVSAGYKISPRELELALEAHPSVARARVVPIADPIRGALARAVVVPAPDVPTGGLSESLQQYLKEELAPYKCPREIQIVER